MSTTPTTDNKSLIAYLKTADELEKAIYTCNEDIVQLRQQYNSIHSPEEPGFPYVNVTKPRYWDGFADSFGAWLFLWFVLFFVIGAVLNGTIMAYEATEDICQVAAVLSVILIVVIRFVQYSDKADNYEQKQNDAKALFDTRMRAYNEAVACTAQARLSINQTIAQIEGKRSRLQAKLDILYKAKILDPFFQNMFAVEHLHLYLNTGMYTSLTGAYRQYMNAYNARQIVTSIGELKAEVRALRRDMNRNHRLMSQQLFDIQHQLDETNSNMSRCIGEINNTLYNIGHATAAQLEEQNRCLSDNLSNMNRTLSVVAHNQYVDGALSHADDFFRHYRLP